MFQCQACKQHEAEKDRLHKIIERLLDKSIGPVLDSKEEALPTEDNEKPPAFERVVTDGKVHETYRYGE